ncbi:chromosome segregation protein SMC [Acidicapsa dinghuensis]|uniref:Chromosome partition protein Smc n=1 Tax=Acidicapsa dinghuensis TaxID=2218256 RepID=A0ABW1ED64_9BACT|nr:chromosome segregation protein SMC [Acidicapsa dinghuensis]
MLRLKKISFIGFKTFCDRTEFIVPGSGIAVIAGPNGCGKSNILDGMSWVLGEQRAKSLRGVQMQDVIFAGTPGRRPLTMAEVTLTLIDPGVYEELLPEQSNFEDESSKSLDWDEDAVRRQRAAEAESIAASPAEHQPLLRQREIAITRRLFRSGESEYLLNGKLCRLRDLQEILLSTGLGQDTYAVIGQEQIGQLLSTKPNDRRAVIEEAAGVGGFQTKKRSIEARLNGATDSLARVDDILEEVSKQVISLRRQAAKAERVCVVREELRHQLIVVTASRIALIDIQLEQLQSGVVELNTQIQKELTRTEESETARQTLIQEGYELDRTVQETQSRANALEVELERNLARLADNTKRLEELDRGLCETASEEKHGNAELADALLEHEEQEALSTSASAMFLTSREKVTARQEEVRRANAAVFGMEQQVEVLRRHAALLMTRTGEIRNRTIRAEESLAMLDREADRLTFEIRDARETLANLDSEKVTTTKRIEEAITTIGRIERETAMLDERLRGSRANEVAARTRANILRAEQAAVLGRHHALDALLRDHGYATETVQKLLRVGTILKPASTLASYLEVDEQHERIVDDFLLDELNYVVVQSWDAAEEGVRLLKSTIDGRATFLVHPQVVEQGPNNRNHHLLPRPGITPLKNQIRVLNGLAESLEIALPKLKDGYLVDSPEEARDLAAEFPDAFFLTSDGECFHNATVTGGSPAREGPLALKGERKITEMRLATIEHELNQAEADGDAQTVTIEQISEELKTINSRGQEVETDLANQRATLKQEEVSMARIERELQDRTSQAARNEEARETKRIGIVNSSQEAEALETAYHEAETTVELRTAELAALRTVHDDLVQVLAADNAELARLSERLRATEASSQSSKDRYTSLQQRLLAIKGRQTAAESERLDRLSKAAELTNQIQLLAADVAESRSLREGDESKLNSLRQHLAHLESELKASRSALERLREDRDRRSQEIARQRADLEHYAATSSTNLGIDAETLRKDLSITRLSAHDLKAAEESCRQLRMRIEQMGPLNMMALDEYKETAVRHEFLQTQRRDLLAEIQCAQVEVKEIDRVIETKFAEAFAQINANFEQVFAQLFSGGQAELRATQAENQREAGLEIAASPPGKRLQNVLLLSGGEKALTALALLVAIFQYRPSPFCVLDEVDAPLDESNIGRFADFMRFLSRDTQFLVVTHSRRMMQVADMIFGITMQEPGISKVLSLRLHSEA